MKSIVSWTAMLACLMTSTIPCSMARDLGCLLGFDDGPLRPDALALLVGEVDHSAGGGRDAVDGERRVPPLADLAVELLVVGGEARRLQDLHVGDRAAGADADLDRHQELGLARALDVRLGDVVGV